MLADTLLASQTVSKLFYQFPNFSLGQPKGGQRPAGAKNGLVNFACEVERW